MTGTKTTPTQITTLSGMTAIAAGLNHSLAVKGDGRVYSFGSNNGGQLGVANTGQTAGNGYTPILINGLTNIAAVAGGTVHSLALTRVGTVYSFGTNSYGQLGNSTATSYTPILVSGLSNVTAIAAGGGHSLALTTAASGGKVYGFGANNLGQLALAGTGNRNVPTQITSLPACIAIAAASNSSEALQSDGTIKAFGQNTMGQLGLGDKNGRTTPASVIGTGPVMALALGPNHSVAVSTRGNVLAAGDNAYGQLGTGPLAQQSTPIPVSSLSNIAAISAASVHSLALQDDGTVLGFGDGTYARLGVAGLENLLPVPIAGFEPSLSIAAGYYSSFATRASDGAVYGVGRNLGYALGAEIYVPVTTPVRAGDTSLSLVRAVASGRQHTLVLKSDRTIGAFGNNSDGQLGDNSTTSSTSPVTVVYSNGGALIPLGSVTAVYADDYHSMALKSDGSLWRWGSGQNSSTSVATQMSGIGSVSAAATGKYHSLAVSSGQVWAFDGNSSGHLGNGTTTDSTTPVRAGTLTDVIAVSPGEAHSLALKRDGTVWAWGSNVNGQLGDGTTTNRLGPVQVSGLQSVVAIAAGGFHNLALKADGAVFSWGSNAAGALGVGIGRGSLLPAIAPGLNVFQGAPTVAISSPANDTAFLPGEPFTLQVQPSDGDGVISRVEFYQEGMKLGESSVAPFAFPFALPSWGDFRLSAFAVDDDGTFSLRSAPVTLRGLVPIWASATAKAAAGAQIVTTVEVAWSTSAAPDATEVAVERQGTPATAWVELVRVPVGTTTTYTDTGRQRGATYTYRVRAMNSAIVNPAAREIARSWPVSVLIPFDRDDDGLDDSNDHDPDNADADGDGISDGEEGYGDTDNDGTDDAHDTDADNDGIPDALDRWPKDKRRSDYIPVKYYGAVDLSASLERPLPVQTRLLDNGRTGALLSLGEDGTVAFGGLEDSADLDPADLSPPQGVLKQLRVVRWRGGAVISDTPSESIGFYSAGKWNSVSLQPAGITSSGFVAGAFGAQTFSPGPTGALKGDSFMWGGTFAFSSSLSYDPTAPISHPTTDPPVLHCDGSKTVRLVAPTGELFGTRIDSRKITEVNDGVEVEHCESTYTPYFGQVRFSDRAFVETPGVSPPTFQALCASTGETPGTTTGARLLWRRTVSVIEEGVPREVGTTYLWDGEVNVEVSLPVTSYAINFQQQAVGSLGMTDPAHPEKGELGFFWDLENGTRQFIDWLSTGENAYLSQFRGQLRSAIPHLISNVDLNTGAMSVAFSAESLEEAGNGGEPQWAAREFMWTRNADGSVTMNRILLPRGATITSLTSITKDGLCAGVISLESASDAEASASAVATPAAPDTAAAQAASPAAGPRIVPGLIGNWEFAARDKFAEGFDPPLPGDVHIDPQTGEKTRDEDDPDWSAWTSVAKSGNVNAINRRLKVVAPAGVDPRKYELHVADASQNLIGLTSSALPTYALTAKETNFEIVGKAGDDEIVDAIVEVRTSDATKQVVRRLKVMVLPPRGPLTVTCYAVRNSRYGADNFSGQRTDERTEVPQAYNHVLSSLGVAKPDVILIEIADRMAPCAVDVQLGSNPTPDRIIQSDTKVRDHKLAVEEGEAIKKVQGQFTGHCAILYVPDLLTPNTGNLYSSSGRYIYGSKCIALNVSMFYRAPGSAYQPPQEDPKDGSVRSMQRTAAHEFGHYLTMSVRQWNKSPQFPNVGHDDGAFPPTTAPLMREGNKDLLTPTPLGRWTRHEDWKAANRRAKEIIK